MFWALALAALAILAGNLALQSSWLRERAARLIEERAAHVLDRPVSIGGLRFELVPLTLELEEVMVGGRQPGEAPLAAVRHAALDAQLFWRGGLRLELRSVRLDEPVVTLIFDEEQGSNLPRVERPSPGQRPVPFQFTLEELTVNRGALVLDHQRLPLDLAARMLSGRLWGVEEPQWRLAAQELEVTLPRARPYLGAVEVRGRFDGRTLELLTTRIAGPDLKVAAHGRFVFGPDRQGALEIAAETGAGLLQRLGYVDDQLAGDFDLGGRVFWEGSDWGVQGAVAARSLRVLDFPLRRVEGVINGDRDGFALELQGADYAGGGVSGAIRLARDSGAPRVALDLQLSAVELEQLLADQGWPLTGVAALVSGPFSYRFDWGEPDRGNGRADLSVSGGSGDGLRFRGSVPLRIERGVLRTAAARLESGRQRLTSSGSYDLDRKQGRFRFQILSDAVEELLPLLELEALAGDSLWQPRGGRGLLAGTFGLSPAGPSLELRLDLSEVSAPGASADQLRGTLAIDTTGIRRMRLELLRPEAGLIVTGTIPFAEAAEPPFALTLDAAGWPLEEARLWLPFELPVTGPTFGAVRLEGSLEELRGTVDVEVRDGRLFEQPVAALAAVLGFGDQRVDFTRLRLTLPAGAITATGSWEQSSDALSLQVESPSLDLGSAPFSGWWSAALAGALALDAEVGGTLAEPQVSGRMIASGLALDGKPLGEEGGARFDLGWRGGRVSADGSLLGLVELSGGGRLAADGVDLDLAVTAPDLEGLARLFGMPADLEVGGSGEGRLRVAGLPGGDEALRTTLRLDRLTLAHRELVLSALEPVELAWTPDALRISSLYLGDPVRGDDLFVVGDVGLAEGQPLDLRFQAGVNTAFVAPLIPALDLEGGRLEVLATIRGSLTAPRINGQGEVSGARLRLGELPPLDRLHGALLFYPDQLVLDSIDGEFAGGRIRVGGTVGLPTADKEVSYRIQLSGEGLTLRYPEGWELRGDTELTVASTADGRQIRGAATLDRALYLRRVQVGLTQLLQSLFQRRRQEVGSTDEELASTQLNLLISGPGALRVRNNVANLRGSIDLALRGTLARPVLFGRIELEPGGTLQVGGSDYTVERGFLTFANPYRMEPVIDLTATTRRRDYDLSLSLSGTLDRLNASLASDPPLADLDVLGLLATGEPTQAGSPALGAEAFLYGQAASLVTERVNRLFNLDRFRVDPLTGTRGNLSSARVTVGKQLSRDVLATYSYDPTQTEQILQLEWSVSRGLVVVVTQNGDGTYAVDARWERSF